MMSTKYYIDGKKVSKKQAEESVGKDALKRMTNDAWQTFMEDPYIQLDFFLGFKKGMLTIEFDA